MNDERPWWAASAYKAPLPRHYFKDTDKGIPPAALAGILPTPWIALIMRVDGGKVNILLQQKYMIAHAETCRDAIEQALLAYDAVTVEFMDCESEAAFVEELYAQTRPVPQPRPTPIRRRSA